MTGGSSGIGLAVARRFVAEGASVVITGRRQAALSSIVRERHGRLDVLVANSGVAEPSVLDEITAEHLDRTLYLNVRATLFTVQNAVPLIGPGSTVVLIGSIAGFIGTPGYTAYDASKAAVRSFARTWTNELAKRGIRVNTLSPGPIDTPMFDGATTDMREALTKMIPLGRLGDRRRSRQPPCSLHRTRAASWRAPSSAWTVE